LENVPELIKSKKHSKNFDKWKDRLDELGYFTVFAVLNGKDFGIPQNRERVFALSIRKDIRNEKDSLALPNADSPFAPPIHRNFDKFVDKAVLEYNGPLMIDPKISNYLLPAYTRDIESIAARSEDPLNRTEIWTCECKSGFQDHRVGIKWAPTIRHQNQHTAIFVNNQITLFAVQISIIQIDR
jgi:site-specific DNA-cytosine methylase